MRTPILSGRDIARIRTGFHGEITTGSGSVIKTGHRVDFGTIAGVWTVAELSEFIKAHDYQIDQLDKAIASSPGWSDTAAWAKFKSDWANFKSDYQSQRTIDMVLIDATPSIVAAYTPAGSGGVAYDTIAKVTAPIVDFDRQFRANPATTAQAPSYPDNPQPDPTNDVDIQAYKALPDVTKPPTKWPWQIWVLIGGGILALALSGKQTIVVKESK